MAIAFSSEREIALRGYGELGSTRRPSRQAMTRPVLMS